MWIEWINECELILPLRLEKKKEMEPMPFKAFFHSHNFILTYASWQLGTKFQVGKIQTVLR